MTHSESKDPSAGAEPDAAGPAIPGDPFPWEPMPRAEGSDPKSSEPSEDLFPRDLGGGD
jgi:hypothetical protein